MPSSVRDPREATVVLLAEPGDHRPRRTLGTVSAARYRIITLVALGALCVIVVSGGAVRLTGSGLGCSDWPACEQDSLVGEMGLHKAVEFGNRLFTGVVSVAVILAVLGSLRRRPLERRLVWWSLGLVGGVIAQIVLGGLVVLSDLNPWLVLGHFQLSMVLVANAVILHRLAGPPRPRPATVPAGWVRLVTALAATALVAGTLVTGSGPHTGSRDDPIERLPFAVPQIVRVHGSIVMALLLATLWLWRKVRTDEDLARRVSLVLVVLVGQGALGYVQYFAGVPELLVGFHIAGATALWVAVLSLHLTALAPRP